MEMRAALRSFAAQVKQGFFALLNSGNLPPIFDAEN
jgi:hypothetical protein